MLEAITRSEVYRNYEEAYAAATGLAVAFRSAEPCEQPHDNHKNENEFGMCAAAVPVRIGDELIGFLQTDQVFTKRPSAAHFERTVKLAQNRGTNLDRARWKETYFQTPYLPRKQFDSMLQMLDIFAEHLALIGNGLLVQRQTAEPPAVTRAKEYIQQNYSSDLCLDEVAKVVNTSVFHFCKIFKKAAGIGFTDYLSRVRIEKSKNLLLNPNLRISEIAYAVGFQSLTHFNRVFRRIVGQAPTQYRDALPWTAPTSNEKGAS